MAVRDVNAPKAKEVSKVVTKGDGEKTYLEKVVEIREKAAEMEMVNEAMGIGKNKGGGTPDLAASVVTGAMNQQKILFDALQNQIAQANLQVSEAKVEREKAQTELYNERITILRAEKEKLDDAAQAAQGAGAPKSEIEVYKRVRKEIADEIGELRKDAPKPQGPQGMSEETMVTLKRLELEQTRVLAQLSADAEQRAQAFNLELRKFDEDAKRRWAEYQDSKTFREQGLAGAQDLLAAIGDGIARERGEGGAKAPRQRARPQPGGEEKLEAFIKSFPCSQCEAKVEIEPGADVAVCPGCGTEYEIQGK